MLKSRFPLLMRQWLFIAVNLLILAVVYFSAIDPIFAIFRNQEERFIHSEKMLDRFRAVVIENSRARSLETRASDTQKLFHYGISISTVAADLQVRLKRLATENGAQIRSMRSMEPTTFENVRYIAIHVEMTGNIQSIHGTIRAVESDRPFLFVSRIALRIPALPMAQRSAQEPILDVQTEIWGSINGDVTR